MPNGERFSSKRRPPAKPFITVMPTLFCSQTLYNFARSASMPFSFISCLKNTTSLSAGGINHLFCLTEELLAGVPLPAFLLTHRVCSSTFSTSIIPRVKPLYFMFIILYLFFFVKQPIFFNELFQILLSNSIKRHY